MMLLALASSAHAQAQKKSAARPQKLPSPEKIIGDYLKATGGKKAQAAVKDSTYEWTIQVKEQAMGRALIKVKAPVSTHTDMTFGNGDIQSAVSARSAWMRGLDGNLRTLTGAEAGAAKLQSTLSASRLIDYKKLNVLARTVAYDETGTEPAYVVEFSTKSGARLRYWFGVNSKLLWQTIDDANKTTVRLGDYRPEGGMLEPHRVEIGMGGSDPMTFLLQSARYNTGINDSVFDPPGSETPDITKLLEEVEKNQEKLDERVSEYAFRERRTERKINDKGEVKEEKVTVSEVFPLPGGGAVFKLISENGVPLTAERAAKEDKRIAEEITKHEEERQKRERKKQEEEAKNKGLEKKRQDDDDVTVAVFLRACEFVSPRRERLRDREAVVFDFRPRAGFKPKSMAENVVTKLIGVVWIDPVDKEVMRLEAKLADSFKVAGGLFASIRPGSSFVFEQTRMSDGVWLPLYAQINFSAKLFLFKTIEANATSEFSNYRRFNAEASDYKLGAPAAETNAPPQP